jgi:hypothetical protein
VCSAWKPSRTTLHLPFPIPPEIHHCHLDTSKLAISSPNLEKKRKKESSWKIFHRHRRAEHERPSRGVTGSASRTTLLPDLLRSVLHHGLIDDVPDEHAQDIQLPGMCCSDSWPLTSSLARKRPSSSWVTLSRAPNTSVPLASCIRDGQSTASDSRLRRKRPRTLSHAPRYHSPLPCISGPNFTNWITRLAASTKTMTATVANSF